MKLPKIKDYGAFLADRWKEHKEPKDDGAPTVISLFAGGGGSSLGYSMSGFRELYAVEWEDNSADTFRLNFPKVPLFQGDIHECLGDHIMDAVGLVPGELDILDGSPPCQGFSTAGKRGVSDLRNQLSFEMIRILDDLKPKAFIMENVIGLTQGKMLPLFVEILKGFQEADYNVKVRVINTQWFGVPQARNRTIFIGFRNDLGITPVFPTVRFLPISVSEAVKGVAPSEVPAFTDRYAKMWDIIPNGRSAAHILPGRRGYTSCYKVHPLKPAPTICKMQTGRGFATMAHWAEKRAISINEVKRFGSFPEQFELTGNYSEQWAIVGNGVPPVFMKYVSQSVKEQIAARIAKVE